MSWLCEVGPRFGKAVTSNHIICMVPRAALPTEAKPNDLASVVDLSSVHFSKVGFIIIKFKAKVLPSFGDGTNTPSMAF